MGKLIQRSVTAALAAAFLSVGTASLWAGQGEFQLGGVLDSWSSNSLFHGSEYRIPASLSYTTGNINLRLNTAFVFGDYQTDASSLRPAVEYKSNQLSDTAFSFAAGIPLGGNLKSFLNASVNIPTGDTKWEGQSQNGAIPVLFEPSFYKGRGFGGNLFYGLNSTGEGTQWGVAAGYLLTTTYDIGLASVSNFNPGDSLLLMGNIGGTLSPTETLGIRAAHSFAFESKVVEPSAKFTAGDGTVLSGQYMKKLGSDKWVLNLAYSFYSPGYVVDPVTFKLTREAQSFLGDRLELNSFLAYAVSPGVAFETGLVWKKITPNGYPETNLSYFQAGGNLLGVEQSATFEMGSGTFLNLAGLYHFVINDKAGKVGPTLTEIDYHQISFGTNVGFKW